MKKKGQMSYIYLFWFLLLLFSSCGLEYINRAKKKKSKTLGVYISSAFSLRLSPVFLRIWFGFISILKQMPHKNINSWFQESSGGGADAGPSWISSRNFGEILSLLWLKSCSLAVFKNNCEKETLEYNVLCNFVPY